MKVVNQTIQQAEQELTNAINNAKRLSSTLIDDTATTFGSREAVEALPNHNTIVYRDGTTKELKDLTKV